ncbi:MAG: 16S rRNA (guanine(527)-N(7))-methyltransferase RsmG [Pseudomonadota bacterium]
MSFGPREFVTETGVSRETLEALEHYAALIAKWSPRINLISKSTLGDIWSRHFMDSAQVFMARDGDPASWCDLGSGGGLPGLVVAIMAKTYAPDFWVTLVESDQRKCVFCRTVIRELGLPAKVITARIEEIAPQSAEILSARALAPLATLLSYAEKHLSPGGVALLPKGESYRQEIEEALASWHFSAETLPSMTDPKAVLLKIKDISRV